MKRVFVLLLTLFYLMFTSGMTISTHYCGGKLTSISLLRLGKEKCPCGSKKMKKDCCKTKSCTFKIKQVQQSTPQLSIDPVKSFSTLHFITYSSHLLISSQKARIELYNHHPPPQNEVQPLYLFNQVFRI